MRTIIIFVLLLAVLFTMPALAAGPKTWTNHVAVTQFNTRWFQINYHFLNIPPEAGLIIAELRLEGTNEILAEDRIHRYDAEGRDTWETIQIGNSEQTFFAGQLVGEFPEGAQAGMHVIMTATLFGPTLGNPSFGYWDALSHSKIEGVISSQFGGGGLPVKIAELKMDWQAPSYPVAPSVDEAIIGNFRVHKPATGYQWFTVHDGVRSANPIVPPVWFDEVRYVGQAMLTMTDDVIESALGADHLEMVLMTDYHGRDVEMASDRLRFLSP
jgi:hypothetical protein